MFQPLKQDGALASEETQYVGRKKNRMDDPEFMPPELLEMLDSETQRVHCNINPLQTPNAGKMKVLFEKKIELVPGSKEPRFMLGPECKN